MPKYCTGSHSEDAFGQYGLSWAESSLLLNRGRPAACSAGGKTVNIRFSSGQLNRIGTVNGTKSKGDCTREGQWMQGEGGERESSSCNLS